MRPVNPKTRGLAIQITRLCLSEDMNVGVEATAYVLVMLAKCMAKDASVDANDLMIAVLDRCIETVEEPNLRALCAESPEG